MSNSNESKESILITGYANLPKDIAAHQLYKVVGLVLEVELETGIIKKVSVTLATTVAQNFIKEILIGKSIDYQYEEIIDLFKRRYWGSARKAIISAVTAAHKRYKEAVTKIKRYNHSSQTKRSLPQVKS